ncbi:MAG: DUF4012 domain-containing protein [Methanobacteriaceae archaeon]|nr:DUF4012 domain-containing protein [Methanobacteriaceae archaeon]
MSRIIKISIIILLAVICVGTLFIAYQYTQAAQGTDDKVNLIKGNQTILLLTVDPSEKRPGLGAVDMAFKLDIVNGSLKGYEPIYPGGMSHPTASPPQELSKYNSKLMLHDTLWSNNTEEGVQLARETIEYNTDIKTDATVIITPAAVDAMIAAIGPIYIEGKGQVSGNSIEFLREEQKAGMNRAEAVESLMKPIYETLKDKNKRMVLYKVAIEQYLQGNIVVLPKSLVMDFAVQNGLIYLL